MVRSLVKAHPYQQAAHLAVRDARLAGKRRILLCSPTGSGKSFMLARITRDALNQGKRALWLVNRRELVAQSVRTLEALGMTVGHSGQNLTASVMVMTYQSALAQGEVPPADLVVPDEAHHMSARGEWISILKAYPEAVVVGATATPCRGDGMALDFFEHLITVAQPMDLVDVWKESGGRMGLVPCHVERPNRELTGLARTPAKATVLHRLKDHQQICFAPHVLAAEQYVAEYRGIGLSCELVTGTTPKDERDRYVADFAARKIRVLVNCQVFTEGTDIPSIEVVTLGGKCSTIGSMLQKTGRGARPSPNKTRFVVLDLFGCTHSLGHPFEDRTYSLEGKGISGPPVERIVLSLCKRCGCQMLDDSDTCPSGCGWKRPALTVPAELNEKLERWEFRRQDQTDDRVTRMAGWIRAAQRRGQYKTAIAISIHTYTGWYREPPAPAIISEAVAIAAGRPFCKTCQHSVRDGRCRCPVADSLTGT